MSAEDRNESNEPEELEGAEPEQPAAEPEQPAAEAEQPAAEPEQPAAEPEQPQAPEAPQPAAEVEVEGDAVVADEELQEPEATPRVKPEIPGADLEIGRASCRERVSECV